MSVLTYPAEFDKSPKSVGISGLSNNDVYEPDFATSDKSADLAYSDKLILVVPNFSHEFSIYSH